MQIIFYIQEVAKNQRTKKLKATMSTTNLEGRPRAKKKKNSTSRSKGHNKVTSISKSQESTRSLNDKYQRKSSRNKKKKQRQKSMPYQQPPQRQQPPQHSRYATAHPIPNGNNNYNNNYNYNQNGYNNNYNNNGYNNNNNNNMSMNNNHQVVINMSKTNNNNYNNMNNNNSKPKKKKKVNRPKNKIKSRNKAHRKAETQQNALGRKGSSNAHRATSTTPNALSVTRSDGSGYSGGGRQKRSPSNPRQFRHKFNMTEMQLVIGQIGEMKKSWKTPAEEVMGRIYEIIDMDERPHLNGKHCKVMLILDDDNYRVALLGNSSEHVVTKQNIKIAFETENLYLLWESQTNKGGSGRKSRNNTKSGGGGGEKPPQPMSPPPHQDPDDMYTIQAFEHSFNETYEFRRYDFYCMAICICLGIICSALGVVLFIGNDKGNDMYAMGAFAIIFAPILGVLIGVYIGCLWYCCTVGKGKMDYYIGKNRFFGFQCKSCDFCKYQYFIVVAIVGILIIIISVASYLLFDQYIENGGDNKDENGNHKSYTNEGVNVDEQRLFLAIEVITGIGGVGLFVFGIIVYYCCTNRKVKTVKGPSIHDDQNFED